MDGSRIYVSIMHTWYNIFSVQSEPCVPTTNRFTDITATTIDWIHALKKNSSLIEHEGKKILNLIYHI
jgi:hypothetical protein